MAVFGLEILVLKTMMFRDLTTVLNERKHLKMLIRSVPDSVSPILGRAECLGLTALHCPFNFELNGASTFLECLSYGLARWVAGTAPGGEIESASPT